MLSSQYLRILHGSIFTVIFLLGSVATQAAQNYQIYISNEKSNDVTVVSGDDFKVIGTIAVGKRPRGIHVSPDGKTLYVAVSGTPIEGPPKLDEHGNPIFNRDDDDDNADKSADGVGVVDIAKKKLVRKISVGSDPEEFALSSDGSRLYVSNEDVKTASVINIVTSKVEHIIPVTQEPEGVSLTPDGKNLYITCETGGDVFVVDTTTYKTIANFKVHPRPRSADFSITAGRGFIPSESTGELNVVDFASHQVLKTVALPTGSRPMRVRVSSDGKRVYVSNGRAGTISVVDTSSYDVIANIKVGTRPWGIALSPDGKYLFAANGPSNDISVVDLVANKEVMRIQAGSSPWGIAIAAGAP
jgi:YVTN family beta-propeller protein